MNLNFTLILQIISFLVLLGVLTKLLYKPFTKYLDDRAKQIKDMLGGAKEAEERAKSYAEEAQKTIEGAKHEAIEIKKENKRLADEERRKIIEEAKKEARFLIGETKSQLGREKELVLKRLRSEISTLSIDVAKKILGREIKKEDHKRIIEESISEIEDVLSGS